MDQDDYDLRMLCVKVGISIVNVNYRSDRCSVTNENITYRTNRKAPECPFPTFMEDSYAALKWVCLRSQFLKY